jgi:hypothetical protein
MDTGFDKAFISFRIGPTLWMPPARFLELLRLVLDQADG